MSENSIGKVLIGRFQNSEKTPSASAFVQQRQKLLPAALETRGIAVPKSYYRIPPTMTFDFLESNSPDFYEISFRIVRLQTGSGNTETLITNLGPGRCLGCGRASRHSQVRTTRFTGGPDF